MEGDGSVAFEAPAGTPMQFQLLDANGMAVMTMRSLVYLQPGERASCIGCHEPREAAPPLKPLLQAQVRQITPPAGPRYEGAFSFMRTVQPVLDRYCISCHGLGRTEGDVNLLRRGPNGRSSYAALTAKGRVKLVNDNSYPSRPRDFFAHGGTLATMLLHGHPDREGRKRVELERESLQRVVGWLDVNAPLHGDYSHNRIETQPPSPEGEKRLREAITKRLGTQLAAQPYAALVNVANPTESRILMAPLPVAAGGWGQIAKGSFSGKSDPAWHEMLNLVEGSVAPPKYHDIADTCGRGDACVCGCCWVREVRAERERTDGGGAQSPRKTFGATKTTPR